MAKITEAEWRQRRLEELARIEFHGKAELERALYNSPDKDGSYVGHMITGRRPISEKTIEKLEKLRGGRYKGWFARPQERPEPPALLDGIQEEPDMTLDPMAPDAAAQLLIGRKSGDEVRRELFRKAKLMVTERTDQFPGESLRQVLDALSVLENLGGAPRH